MKIKKVICCLIVVTLVLTSTLSLSSPVIVSAAGSISNDMVNKILTVQSNNLSMQFDYNNKLILKSMKMGGTVEALDQSELSYSGIESMPSVLGCYEAENATTNHCITYSNSRNASGGYYVGGIDYSDSYIQFSNVKVPVAGAYDIEVRYANGYGQTSTQTVLVNNQQEHIITYPITSGWGSTLGWSSVKITVSLNAGNNTLKFSKGSNSVEIDNVEIIRDFANGDGIYEAENAALSDCTTYTDSSTASGGQYVGGINNSDSYVQFNNVNAQTAGMYDIEVRYVNGSGQDGTHSLSVNGGTAQQISYPVTSGWGSTNDWNTIIIRVSLNEGNNTLRFSKGSNYVELDYIKVLNQSSFEAESAETNDCITYSNSTDASGGQYVGGIDNSDSYIQFNNVNVSVAGIYDIEIRYANGSGQDGTHNLSVNGGIAQSVNYPITTGWGSTNGWSTIIISVSLNAGNNTLRFSKGTNYAEMDRIELFSESTYEAEDANINQCTNYTNITSASSGKYIGGIDYSNSYVQFETVKVIKTGTYYLKIIYANGYGQQGTHGLSVNGGVEQTVTYPVTTGWGSTGGWGSVFIKVNLNAGNNTIRFSKGENFAEIDCIKVLCESVYRMASYEAEDAESSDCISYTNSTSASGGKYIGGIDNTDSYVQFSHVRVSKAGVYDLKIIYANGYGQEGTHNLSVNGGAVQTVTYPVTSGWGSTNGWSSVTISINLNAGDNSLRFSKGINHAEIDCIKLVENEWGGTNSLKSSPIISINGNVVTFSNVSYIAGNCNVNETWTITANDNNVDLVISRTYAQSTVLKDQYSMLLSFKESQFDTIMRTEDGGSLILMDPDRNVNRFLSHEHYSDKHTYGYYTYPNTYFNLRTTANVDLIDKGNQDLLSIELASNRNRATKFYRNSDPSSSRALQIQHKLNTNEFTLDGKTKEPVDMCDAGTFDPVVVSANQNDIMTYTFSCQNNLDKYYDLGTIPAASGINEYNLAQYLQDMNRSGVMDLSFGNSDCCPGGMGEYEYYNYSVFALGLQSTGNEAFINTLKNVGTFFKDYGYNSNGTVKGRIFGEMTNWDAGNYLDMPTQFVLGTANTFDLCDDRNWLDSMAPCMRSIIDHYIASDSNDNGLIESGDNSGNTRDWNDNVYIGSENGYANVLFYSALERWADIESNVYGNSTRATQYRNFAVKLKTTFNKNIADGGLWDPNNHWFAYWRNTDTNSVGGDVGHIFTNALPIIFGMVDKERAQQILDKFTAFKTSNGLTLFPTQQAAWNSSEIISGCQWEHFEDGSIYIQMQREMMGAFASVGNASMPLNILNQCTSRYMQDNLWWVGPLNWDLTKDTSYDEAWMAANGRPATGFYEFIMGIHPKYNQLTINPCVDSTLYGVNIKYTLRGHHFSVGVNSATQRTVETDGNIPIIMDWSNQVVNSQFTITDENLTSSITTTSVVSSDSDGNVNYSFSTAGNHRLTIN
jgi:hypothetical protein